MTPKLPSQAVRRRDVLLLLTTYPIGTVALYTTIGESSWYALAHLLLTVLVLVTLGIYRVGRAGRVIADDVDDRLDERQLALRNSAYLDAYRIVSLLVVLGVIWIAIGTDKGYWWIPSTYNEWNAILWGLFIYLTTLPSAFLAWREPDRLEDQEYVDA